MQQPTETLPTGQEASQRVSLLFQAHALALKKLAFLMTGGQATAEDIVILGEANRQVLLAIRRLPARQREAVVLRYYLDMTEDQAAQARGVSRGTVKSANPVRLRLRQRPAPVTRRWRSVGVPLAAAAAVVLVALSLVVVRQLSTPTPAVGGPVANAPATAPRYYVALDPAEAGWTGIPASGVLTVGDDHTGKAVATVIPPHGVHFDGVQGASDDRTFVVEATSGTGPETWYLLRIAPGTTHPYQLTKLPIKLPGSSPDAVGYALSPDDRELAVESVGDTSTSGTTTRVALYSVSSGAELRAWTTRKFAMSPILSTFSSTFSWLSGGRQLAFTDVPPGADQGGSNQLRTLDVTGSGTDLVTASRVLLTLKNPSTSPSSCFLMNLTPDGGTVICDIQYGLWGAPGTNAGCANGGIGFTAYSVRTGKPVRVSYQYRGACNNGVSSVLWSDAARLRAYLVRPAARYITFARAGPVQLRP